MAQGDRRRGGPNGTGRGEEGWAEWHGERGGGVGRMARGMTLQNFNEHF